MATAFDFDRLPIFEIWFNLYDADSQPLSIKVRGIESARDAWDRLVREFFMLSTRP